MTTRSISSNSPDFAGLLRRQEMRRGNLLCLTRQLSPTCCQPTASLAPSRTVLLTSSSRTSKLTDSMTRLRFGGQKLVSKSPVADGALRFAAASEIHVLARIRPLDHEGMLGVQFAENERRQDISAIERARWLAQVKDRYGKQVQQLADDYNLDRTTVSLYLRLARLPDEIVQRLVDARALPMLKARRLIAALEQDAGALARVTGALDSQLSACEARGSRPSPDDQVEVAIRAAEGRNLPRSADDTTAAILNDKRVIVHRGRRVGTLIRNGGQWVVRFASTTDDQMVLAIAERLSGLMEQIETEQRERKA